MTFNGQAESGSCMDQPFTLWWLSGSESRIFFYDFDDGNSKLYSQFYSQGGSTSPGGGLCTPSSSGYRFNADVFNYSHKLVQPDSGFLLSSAFIAPINLSTPDY